MILMHFSLLLHLLENSSTKLDFALDYSAHASVISVYKIESVAGAAAGRFKKNLTLCSNKNFYKCFPESKEKT